MTYRIETESDLIKALKECRDGDIIYQTVPRISCTETGLICYKSVTFINLSILLIYRHYNEVEHLKPYLTITKDGMMINPAIQGIMPENPTTWEEDGVQLGIRIDGAKEYTFVNPTATCVNHTAYQITNCDNCKVYSGYLYDCATPKDKYGFGHPFWVGGDGAAMNQWTYFYGTRFENNRHCIASSKHFNSVHVEGCNFKTGKYSKHILDRHGDNQEGGLNFFVIGCKFENPDNYAYDFAKNFIRFEGCIFSRPFGKNGRVGGVTEREGLEEVEYINCTYNVG